MPPEVLQSRPKRDRHDHPTAKGQVTVDQSCRHRRTRDDNTRVQVESTPIRVALQQGRFVLAPQTKAPQIRYGPRYHHPLIWMDVLFLPGYANYHHFKMHPFRHSARQKMHHLWTVLDFRSSTFNQLLHLFLHGGPLRYDRHGHHALY